MFNRGCTYECQAEIGWFGSKAFLLRAGKFRLSLETKKCTGQQKRPAAEDSVKMIPTWLLTQGTS